MLLWTVLFGAGFAAFWYFFTDKRRPLHGIYGQPGTWFTLKRWLVYAMIWWRRKWTKNKTLKTRIFDDATPEMIDSERPQPLQHHKQAIDSVYFVVGDKDGHMLSVRIGRRHDRKAEIWLALNVPNVGVFTHPIHPDTTLYNCDPRQIFSAGGLKIEPLEPLRSWRISFNGPLRHGIQTSWSRNEDKLVHVKFYFIWRPLSRMIDPEVCADAWLTADAVAREKWTAEWREKGFRQQKSRKFFEQCGGMHGILEIDGHPERKLSLRGTRYHSYGVLDWREYHRFVSHRLYTEDGSFYIVHQTSHPGILSELRSGYVVRPNAQITALSDTDLRLAYLAEHRNVPSKYKFSITADDTRSYKIRTRTLVQIPLFLDDWSRGVIQSFCTIEVNGFKGFGVADFGYRFDDQTAPPIEWSLPLLASTYDKQSTNLVVAFTEEDCCNELLVGGKGTQLALLTKLCNQDQHELPVELQTMFSVPPGYCVTTSAYEKFLSENNSIGSLIRQLQSSSCALTPDDAACEAQCKTVADAILHAQLPDVLVDAIRRRLGELAQYRLAVRSSAVGEDSEELSAAGQEETLLGVLPNDVPAAVLKSWASHFDFVALQYRRKNGQPVSSPMAVVIQKMVPSQTSGVLFTVDPLTGDRSKMVINACLGLGEAVVSGVTNPDMITLRKGIFANRTEILNIQVGEKEAEIVMKDSGGTEKHTLNISNVCCLDDATIERLGRIGLLLEKSFGNARDIEWATYDNEIYLLQARPITCPDVTDYELLHEFDTPLASDQEWVTTSNISEMMPGAVTPLSIGVFYRGIDAAIQKMQQNIGYRPETHSVEKSLCLHQANCFINITNMSMGGPARSLGGAMTTFGFALCGQSLAFIDVKLLKHYHGELSYVAKLISTVWGMLCRYKSSRKNAYWEQVLKTYKVPIKQNAAETYDSIDEHMLDYVRVWHETLGSSGMSAMFSTTILGVLMNKSEEFTNAHMEDLALLLSNCQNVYSADIPSALREFSKKIAESGKVKEFLALSAEDAVEWLRSSKAGSLTNEFNQFLDKHGHRCVREAELRELSWHLQPSKVIVAVQTYLKANPDFKAKTRDLSVDDAIAQVKLPLNRTQRLALRHLVPRARTAVGKREWGKSLAIKMGDAFRVAYRRLAEQMVLEGILPDSDLIFFFTHYELGKFVCSRSARLLSRAVRRRKLLPKQFQLHFANWSLGSPQPEEDDSLCDESVLAVETFQGTPVGTGVTQGHCRVITTLEEAAQIQSGDILVVPYTDVGWTPYFPLISGLITELGGIISHGAVVAREYGIPCVVNCKRATKILKTGDFIRLDGGKGVVTKLTSTNGSNK